MNKRNLTNKEIDKVGSKLLKVTKPSDEEVENIIADPKLFDSITARIKADEQIAVKSKQGLLSWNWLKISLLNQQMAISVAAILLVFFVFVAMIFVSNQKSNPIAENSNPIIKKEPQMKDFAQSETPLPNTETEITEKDFVSKSKEKTTIQPIAFKEKKFRKLKPIRKKKSAKQKNTSAKTLVKSKNSTKPKTSIDKSQQLAKNEPKKVFYMLPYGGNAEIKKENVKIISAKLSRSELFALGVNLQLENEDSAIETELIIGNDGVARAIRVIEKF